MVFLKSNIRPSAVRTAVERLRSFLGAFALLVASVSSIHCGGSDNPFFVTGSHRELVALSSTVATPMNRPVEFSLQFRTSYVGDPDLFIDAQPSKGTLARDPLGRNLWTYSPGVDFNGIDSFEFHAEYGSTASNGATVTVSVGNAFLVPTAFDQSISTPEDTPKDIVLYATDPEDDFLTFYIVDYPLHGTLELIPGGTAEWRYTPEGDYHGEDRFTFYAHDGVYSSDIATVSIMVGPVNDPPVAYDQSVATDEDVPVEVVLEAFDPDGDELAYHISAPPSHGSLIHDGPNCVYTPDGDYHGTDSFTFYVNDGLDDSPPATVTVTVRPVNDGPVAMSARHVVILDTETEINLMASDPDGDDLSFHIDEWPVHGSLVQADGPLWRYTPPAGYLGPDSFTFFVEDSSSSRSDTATVTVAVIPEQIIFVRSDAPDGGDGAWWDTAFNRVQDAIDAAGPSCRLWIAGGVYTRASSEEIVLAELTPGVTLLGGFAGSEYREEDRDPSSHETVLDGENAARHVIRGAPGVLIDGLTVRGGNADGPEGHRDGGGIINIDCGPVITNCRFVMNRAADSGGAIHNDNASPVISHTTFIGNVALKDGGAIHNRAGSHPVITQCVFSDNDAGYDGGAIYVYLDAFLDISDSTFTGNNAADYGGALCDYGASTIARCQFTNNAATLDGGAICDRINASGIQQCEFNGNAAGRCSYRAHRP